MASKRAGMIARFFKRREQPVAVQPDDSVPAINEPAVSRGQGTAEVLNPPVAANAPKPALAQETTAAVEPVGAVVDTGATEVLPGSSPAPVQDPESTPDTDTVTDTVTEVATESATEVESAAEATAVTASSSAVEPETAPAPAAGTDGAEPDSAQQIASIPDSNWAAITPNLTADAASTPDTAATSDSDGATITPDLAREAAAVAAARIPAPTGVRELRVVTIISLVEHAGAATVAAALGNRAEAKRWQIRATGPGLTRAAFSGMLTDTDALVLVSPADPASTAVLGEKLRWLIANNRPALPARTIFVINLGSGEADALEVPADLENPLVLLPLDPALALPAATPRAPRRAARRAIDQLVEEISAILEEQN